MPTHKVGTLDKKVISLQSKTKIQPKMKKQTIISIIIAIWSAAKGLTAVRYGLNEVYRSRESRNYLIIRSISAIYTILFVVLVLFLIPLNMFGTQIALYILNKFPNLTHVTLLGKHSSVYEYGEHLNARISIKAYRLLKELCIRVEIHALSGIPVGVSNTINFTSINEGDVNSFDFDINFNGLVTGEYAVCLVLYEVDSFGNFEDLDAVFPAFIFEIRDKDNQLKIDWHHSNWGYIRFPDLKQL